MAGVFVTITGVAGAAGAGQPLLMLEVLAAGVIGTAAAVAIVLALSR
jgi:hypothetical protein